MLWETGGDREKDLREIPPTGSGAEEECSCEPDRTDCRVEKDSGREEGNSFSADKSVACLDFVYFCCRFQSNEADYSSIPLGETSAKTLGFIFIFNWINVLLCFYPGILFGRILIFRHIYFTVFVFLFFVVVFCFAPSGDVPPLIWTIHPGERELCVRACYPSPKSGFSLRLPACGCHRTNSRGKNR